MSRKQDECRLLSPAVWQLKARVKHRQAPAAAISAAYTAPVGAVLTRPTRPLNQPNRFHSMRLFCLPFVQTKVSMGSIHDSRERVAIPPGFSIGLLFGRQGSHLQEVKQRTRARIRIDCEARHIDLAGTPKAVQAALAFYRACFAEHAAAGANAVIPTEAVILIAPELSKGAHFVPLPPGGEIALHPAERILHGSCSRRTYALHSAPVSPTVSPLSPLSPNCLPTQTLPSLSHLADEVAAAVDSRKQLYALAPADEHTAVAAAASPAYTEGAHAGAELGAAGEEALWGAAARPMPCLAAQAASGAVAAAQLALAAERAVAGGAFKAVKLRCSLGECVPTHIKESGCTSRCQPGHDAASATDSSTLPGPLMLQAGSSSAPATPATAPLPRWGHCPWSAWRQGPARERPCTQGLEHPMQGPPLCMSGRCGEALPPGSRSPSPCSAWRSAFRRTCRHTSAMRCPWPRCPASSPGCSRCGTGQQAGQRSAARGRAGHLMHRPSGVGRLCAPAHCCRHACRTWHLMRRLAMRAPIFCWLSAACPVCRWASTLLAPGAPSQSTCTGTQR